MEMPELREKAKLYGINSFGMKKEDLVQAIGDAEMEGETKVMESTKGMEAPKRAEAPKRVEAPKATVTVQPEPQNLPATAPTMSNEMAVAMMAAKMAEDAQAMLKNMAAQQPTKKKSTPEQEISNRIRSDREAIRGGETRKLTIPGGYVGCPEYVTSSVNGHTIQIKTGEEVSLPIAHYENITRAWKLKQQNANKFKAMEQKALQS